MALQVVMVKDLYSDYVDDKETIDYFLLLHDMTLEPMLNAYPEVDFLPSGLVS